MKNKINLLILILVGFSFFTLKSTYSQFDYLNRPFNGCGMDHVQASDLSYQFPFFPMEHDTLKALVVFCNYADENFDPGLTSDSYVYLNYWPGSYPEYLTKPTWGDSVICPTTTNVWNRSLTQLYRDGSMGKFWLIGDVYPSLVILDNKANYVGSDKGVGYAVKQALESIDANVNFANYDKFDPWDYDNDGNRREPDGIVDFVFIMMRFINGGSIDGYSYTGVAQLGGLNGHFGKDETNNYVYEITLDGKTIKSDFPGCGCITEVFNPWDNIGIISHEFGEHYCYGSGHSGGLGSYNINGFGLASAYDREHNGWSSGPTYAPTSNTTITLGDYVTTNDYAKITRTNDVIFLENRRRISYFSSEDYIIWKWLFYEPLRPVQSDSMLLIYRNTGYRTFDIQSANGYWNWQMCSNKYKSLYYSNTYNYFFPDVPNRYGGISTFGLWHVNITDENCQDYPFATGSYKGCVGDSNTCFDIGYNDVYSPWSNPPIPVNNSNDSLTIEIAGKNQDGELIINVYFTNITDAKPSKPQGLRVGWTECDGFGDTKYPILTWQHNLEPDMIFHNVPTIDFKKYKIYRAYTQIGAGIPNDYTEIAEELFEANTDPIFIDEKTPASCDYSLEPQYDVYYKVQAIDNTNLASCLSDYASTQVSEIFDVSANKKSKVNIPKAFNLCQNYPNPFNPVTNIKYELPKDVLVSLKVFDILGREIKTIENSFKKAGSYITSFDGSGLASGIYFYRIVAGNFVSVKRMVLIK
jgi:M6 family metalloprotease-like protein